MAFSLIFLLSKKDDALCMLLYEWITSANKDKELFVISLLPSLLMCFLFSTESDMNVISI
jgi:hypothetical protein